MKTNEKSNTCDGNNGNVVTVPSVTNEIGNQKLPESEIRVAYYQAKGSKDKPSARDVRKILGKGSFRDIQRVVNQINKENIDSKMRKIDNIRVPPEKIEIVSKALAKLAIETNIKNDDEKMKEYEDLVFRLNSDLKNMNEEWAEVVDEKELTINQLTLANTNLVEKLKVAEELSNKYKNESETLHVEVRKLQSELDKLNAIKMIYEKIKGENQEQ